jgi:hypothetical protein
MSCGVKIPLNVDPIPFMVHWFQRHPNGTITNHGTTPETFASSTALRTAFGGNRINTKFSHDMVGDYWCQPVLTTTSEYQLSTSAIVTIREPSTYSSDIPVCSGVQKEASNRCIINGGVIITSTSSEIAPSSNTMSTSSSTGMNPSSIGMSPSTTSTGMSPSTTSTRMSPQSTSMGMSPQSTSMGMSPQSTSTGMNPSSTSTGMSPFSMPSMNLDTPESTNTEMNQQSTSSYSSTQSATPSNAPPKVEIPIENEMNMLLLVIALASALIVVIIILSIVLTVLLYKWKKNKDYSNNHHNKNGQLKSVPIDHIYNCHYRFN